MPSHNHSSISNHCLLCVFGMNAPIKIVNLGLIFIWLVHSRYFVDVRLAFDYIYTEVGIYQMQLIVNDSIEANPELRP